MLQLQFESNNIASRNSHRTRHLPLTSLRSGTSSLPALFHGKRSHAIVHRPLPRFLRDARGAKDGGEQMADLGGRIPPFEFVLGGGFASSCFRSVAIDRFDESVRMYVLCKCVRFFNDSLLQINIRRDGEVSRFWIG